MASKIKKLSRQLRTGTGIPSWVPRLLRAKSLASDCRRERDLKQASHLAKGRLLDIGCGLQPYRSLFPSVSTYVGIDLLSINPQVVDVHGNGLLLPFRNGSFDTVLCTQVLEHIPRPQRMLGEIGRILKPGGCLILTVPHISFLHDEPHDYFRFTKYGVRFLLESNGFEVLYIQPQGGYWLSAGTTFSYYLWKGNYVRILLTWPLVVLVQTLSIALDWLETVEAAALNYIAVGTRTQQRDLPSQEQGTSTR